MVSIISSTTFTRRLRHCHLFRVLFLYPDVAGRDPLVKPVVVPAPFHENFIDFPARLTFQNLFDKIHILIGFLEFLFVKRSDYPLVV